MPRGFRKGLTLELYRSSASIYCRELVSNNLRTSIDTHKIHVICQICQCCAAVVFLGGWPLHIVTICLRHRLPCVPLLLYVVYTLPSYSDINNLGYYSVHTFCLRFITTTLLSCLVVIATVEADMPVCATRDCTQWRMFLRISCCTWMLPNKFETRATLRDF